MNKLFSLRFALFALAIFTHTLAHGQTGKPIVSDIGARTTTSNYRGAIGADSALRLPVVRAVPKFWQGDSTGLFAYWGGKLWVNGGAGVGWHLPNPPDSTQFSTAYRQDTMRKRVDAALAAQRAYVDDLDNALYIRLSKYGAFPDDTADDTYAVQAAVNYASSLTARAPHLIAERGKYLFKKKLDPLSKAHIYMPDRGFDSLQTITITGVAPPDYGSYAGLSNSFTEQAHATIFQSTVSDDTGAILGARATDRYGYGKFTYCWPAVEKIVFRSRHGAPMAGVDGYRMINLYVDYCVADIDTPAWSADSPSIALNRDGRYASAGFIFPAKNNNTIAVAKRSAAYGKRRGIDANEHSQLDDVHLVCNIDGLYHNNADHSSNHGLVIGHWNRYHYTNESADGTVNIRQLRVEDFDPANMGMPDKWYNSRTTIRGGHARGDVIVSYTNHKPIPQAEMQPVLENTGNMELYVMAAFGNWVNKSEVDVSTSKRVMIRGINGVYNTNYGYGKHDNGRGAFFEEAEIDSVTAGNRVTIHSTPTNSVTRTGIFRYGLASNNVPYFSIIGNSAKPASQYGEVRPWASAAGDTFGVRMNGQDYILAPAAAGGSVAYPDTRIPVGTGGAATTYAALTYNSTYSALSAGTTTIGPLADDGSFGSVSFNGSLFNGGPQGSRMVGTYAKTGSLMVTSSDDDMIWRVAGGERMSLSEGSLLRLNVNYGDATSGAGMEHYDGAGVVARVWTAYDGGSSTVDRIWGAQYRASVGGYNGNELMRLKGNGRLGIGTNAPTTSLQVVGLPEYTDNAAAIAAGLTTGAFYRTGDLLKVVH